MSSVTRPRGPLPPRVYWTRRLLLVVVALALVFGFARLFGGGGDSSGPSARPVDSSVRPSSTSPSGAALQVAATPTISGAADPSSGDTATNIPLPGPQGRCADDDIRISPSIKGFAYAGSPVVFALSLTTAGSPACTWSVSPSTLVLKITSGPDRIWSTQDCRGAILKQDVVVRKDTPTVVDLAWNARRSNAGCTSSSGWVEPGYYHAVVAAWGSEPVDDQFRLLNVVPQTTTAYPKPRKGSSASPEKSSSASPKAAPTNQGSPSGPRSSSGG